MSGIAVTGIGLVTALGATRESSWRAMVEGQCGVRPVSVFDTEGFRSRVAAEVDLRALDGALTPLERRRLSRGDRIALHAAGEAITDAGFRDGAYDASRVGIFLGAGTGDLLRNEDYYRTWITRGLDRARPSSWATKVVPASEPKRTAASSPTQRSLVSTFTSSAGWVAQSFASSMPE